MSLETLSRAVGAAGWRRGADGLAFALITAATLELAVCQLSGGGEGDSLSTNYCCKEVDWTGEWCRATRGCLGEGCQNTNASACPALTDCICYERVKYQSTSTCSLLKSCAEAYDDYTQAVKKAEELSGMKLTQMPGCEDAIINVICAYHFPSCTDDQNVAEKICISTCQSMYSRCKRQYKCDSTGNRTMVDDFGQPIIDTDGNEVQEPCGNSTWDTLAGLAGGVLNDANDLANDALAAAGTSSSGVSGAISDALGGRRRKVSSRTEELMGWDAVKPRGVIDDVYYEFEPGQIKLADFARDGARCNTCLTPTQVKRGERCPRSSEYYRAADGRGETPCTGPAGRPSPPCVVSMVCAALLVSAGVQIYGKLLL
jgi:hypothetical protein